MYITLVQDWHLVWGLSLHGFKSISLIGWSKFTAHTGQALCFAHDLSSHWQQPLPWLAVSFLHSSNNNIFTCVHWRLLPQSCKLSLEFNKATQRNCMNWNKNCWRKVNFGYFVFFSKVWKRLSFLPLILSFSGYL